MIFLIAKRHKLFAAGTLFKDAYQTMANNMPNVVIGNTGGAGRAIFNTHQF